jgi:hypothetical protein
MRNSNCNVFRSRASVQVFAPGLVLEDALRAPGRGDPQRPHQDPRSDQPGKSGAADHPSRAASGIRQPRQ